MILVFGLIVGCVNFGGDLTKDGGLFNDTRGQKNRYIE